MLQSLRAKLRLRALRRLWVRYHDVAIAAFDSDTVTAGQERAFLALKAKIAARLQFLPETVSRGLDAEVRREVDAITDLLKRHRSLASGNDGTPWTREEFDRLWHGHYIFLSKLKGTPLGGPATPKPKRGDVAPSGLGKRWVQPRRGRRVFRIVLRIAVVVLVAFIVGSALGVQLDGVGRLALDVPDSYRQALDNVTGAASGVWLGFVGPLVSTYGMVVTVFLLGILVLLSGYWVFLRG